MLRVMSADGGEISKALRAVIARIKVATAARKPPVSDWCKNPRLVAVSKTKPKEMVIEAYLAGQRHFGENYVQELVDKARDPEILERCPEIRWHMIGPMQSNKTKKVLSLPHLNVVETVHSVKLATQLNAIWPSVDKEDKLSVFVQVNTSSEPQKSGVPPEEVTELTDHIINNCPELRFLGLMTIGIFDYDLANGPNPDFQRLLECRDMVCEHHAFEPKNVELSMGMSADFEHAISVGSSNVRVGSTIFGARSHP